GDRLARALALDEIVREYAAQVRVGGDEIGHDVEAGRRLTVGNLVGDQLEAGIFRGEFLLEAFVAGLKRADAWKMRNQRHVALGLSVFGGDRRRHAVGGDAAALDVVGGQERSERLRVRHGVDADDRHLLGGFVYRVAE